MQNGSRANITALALATVLGIVAAAPSAAEHDGKGEGNRSGRLLRAEDFVKAHRPIPGVHPTLPICRSRRNWEGYRTREEAQRSVDFEARATCQADPTAAVYGPALPRTDPGHGHAAGMSSR